MKESSLSSKAEDYHRRILQYVEEHGVSDKDKRASGPGRHGNKKNGIEKTRKGLLRKVIDLHGMTILDAEPALGRAMEECEKKGIKELLIIHGWGRHSNPAEGGVLKKMVLDALEYRYIGSLRGYKPALPREGGEGATLVMLK
jgi:DNA-nicking Smr family endonuclease